MYVCMQVEWSERNSDVQVFERHDQAIRRQPTSYPQDNEWKNLSADKLVVMRAQCDAAQASMSYGAKDGSSR